jgi:hypothetical protein
MRDSMVVIWHTGQGGRWINMMLRLDQAGARYSQSPVVAKKGGDGTTMRPEFREALVSIAHISKVNDLRGTAAPADHHRVPSGRWACWTRDQGGPRRATCPAANASPALTAFDPGEVQPSRPSPARSIP